MSLAFHFDEVHVVFPSSIASRQGLGQGPRLCCGNPCIRGAMNNEHLAPYGSAGRQQIPPGFEVISLIEEVEQVSYLR